MSDEAPLASLSLTHVHYDPSDPVSYLCAWLALVPQGLCVVYATLVWSTREAEVALMFAGQLLCEALNFALKRLIKEERPRRMYGKGYGMPSSHAQFVAYFAVSLALFLVVRHRPATPPTTGQRRRNHTPMSLPERVAWSLGGLGMAAAVAWSRIYLNYHTEKQVLVGSGAGAASAVVWFVITSILRQSGWLAWALDLPPARFLRARDLVVEEDLCQAGWEKWDDKMTALKAKKGLKNQ
ncbi:PAP2-domain-containing protein [Apiospora aurea]|uniref:Dolichyldiphosphatase n=1 Tax=Apiospora aurea TaxID=335848 RepID=A0ABR1QYH1_9PEZI